MRKIVRDIIEMANDVRISDEQFREAIRNLSSVNLRGGVIGCLKELRENAIYESEREEFVR